MAGTMIPYRVTGTFGEMDDGTVRLFIESSSEVLGKIEEASRRAGFVLVGIGADELMFMPASFSAMAGAALLDMDFVEYDD